MTPLPAMPTFRVRPDGTPEILRIGSFAAGEPVYETTEEAWRVYAAVQRHRARSAPTYVQMPLPFEDAA